MTHRVAGPGRLHARSRWILTFVGGFALVAAMSGFLVTRSDPADTGHAPRTSLTISPHEVSAVPFDGVLLVYGRHALTGDQVQALSTALGRPVTAVHGGEIAVASGRSDFPIVPVLMFTADARSYATAANAPGP